MTVDSVNTSVFDDNEITGILCACFVGMKLEQCRFLPNAIKRGLESPPDLSSTRRNSEAKRVRITDSFSTASGIVEGSTVEIGPDKKTGRTKAETVDLV